MLDLSSISQLASHKVYTNKNQSMRNKPESINTQLHTCLTLYIEHGNGTGRMQTHRQSFISWSLSLTCKDHHHHHHRFHPQAGRIFFPPHPVACEEQEQLPFQSLKSLQSQLYNTLVSKRQNFMKYQGCYFRSFLSAPIYIYIYMWQSEVEINYLNATSFNCAYLIQRL